MIDGDKEKTDSRSLEAEDQLFTISESEARVLFAQPKRRRGQQAAKPGSYRGDRPGDRQAVELKDGRFGPYVTDGETNASLRKGDDPETITIERASELLADRRAAGPAKKRKKTAKKKKAATKKASAAKSPAKKAASSKPPKKAAAKKAAKRRADDSSVDTAEDPF